MKKAFVVLACGWILSGFLSSNAQEITLTGDVNTSEFPTVEIPLNLYDPDLKSKNAFEVSENGQPVEFELENLPLELNDTTKNVLILVEDIRKYHGNQTDDFKRILKKAVPRFMRKGDKLMIAFFDRNRDGSTPLRPLLPEFTSDTSALLEALDTFAPPADRFNTQPSSDLYNAVYDGISMLKEKFPGRNNVLVVMSGGKNLELSNYNSLTDLTAYARENKIPVYSLQYMVYEHENIDALAKGSYGKYFHIRGTYPLKGNHDVQTASDSLVSFMNGAVERLQGKNYLLRYRSRFDRDGRMHTVTIKTGSHVKEIGFTAPDCDWKCWYERHKIRIRRLAVPLGLLTILLIGLWIRNRLKKRREKARMEALLASQEEALGMQQQIASEIERKAREAERKARELQQRLEEEKRRRRQTEEQQRLQEIIREMQSAKGFARLRIIRDRGYEDREINKPSFTVGKDKSNDLRLDDPAVSAKHFRIVYRDGRYYAEDTGSTNGTYVNGRRIDRRQLKHNDIIEAGRTKMIFIQ